MADSKIVVSTLNLCGLDPHNTSNSVPPFEFNDGSFFMQRMHSTIHSCIHQADSIVAGMPFILDAQNLHPLMSRPVIRLFKKTNDDTCSLHEVLTSPMIAKFLIADRFVQPIGIGGCNGLPQMTTTGVQSAFELNRIFVEVLQRARRTYSQFGQQKTNQLFTSLREIGCVTENLEHIFEALATAQTLYQAAQTQMVCCHGGISQKELQDEYTKRINPTNRKGTEKLLKVIQAKILDSDVLCLNEVHERMIIYLEENLPTTARCVYCQPVLEGQDTILIYNTDKLALSSKNTPSNLFIDTMGCVKRLEEIQTGKRLKDISTKANFLLEFELLHAPGFQVWIVPVHLSSNGDHVPLIPSCYDLMRRHTPKSVLDILLVGDFNNTSKTHQRFSTDLEYMGIVFTPPLTSQDGRGVPTTIKQREVTVQTKKAAIDVRKTCDGVLSDSPIDYWEVYGNHVVASSTCKSTSFSTLPTQDFVSDHYGVTAIVYVSR